MSISVSLHSCQHLALFFFFIIVNNFSGYMVLYYYRFSLYFSMTGDVEHLVFISHLFIFGELSIQIICPSLNWAVFFLSCRNSFYMLNTSPFSDNMICKYLLLVCGLSFHFPNGVF